MNRRKEEDIEGYTNRFVFVGSVAAGKTTLFNALIGRKGEALKTQAMEFEEGIVDTPGEFFSHPRLYHALINTVAEAETVVYVHACDEREYRMPPGLLQVNADKDVIGVVTKIDLPEADPEGVERMLRENGFRGRIFKVSVHLPATLEPLRSYLYGEGRKDEATR